MVVMAFLVTSYFKLDVPLPMINDNTKFSTS